MDYVNPGDAAGQALQQFLLERRQQQQQAFVNSILAQSEARKARNDDLDYQAALAKVNEQKETLANTALNQRKTNVVKRWSGMLPGDIAPPDLVKETNDLGMAGEFSKQDPATHTTIPASDPRTPTPGLTLDPSGAPSQQSAPLPGALPATEATIPGAIRVMGTPQQRQAATERDAQKQFADMIESGANPQAIAAAGFRLGVDPKVVDSVITATRPKPKKAEAGFVAFGPDKKEIPGIVEFDDAGTPYLNGQSLPQGAIVQRAPAPRDPLQDRLTQAQIDALNRKPVAPPDAAEVARLDRSYQFNSTQLEAFAKPIEDRARNIQKLESTLSQNSPQADALVAPELLTIMAGGQGSGLRINEAEINRLVGGRNHWQELQSAVEKWSTDPNHTFLITPEQRQQVRSLLGAVRKDLTDQLSTISSGRDQLIGGKSVEDHRRVVAEVKRLMMEAPKDTGGGEGSLPKVGDMFNGGKVLSIKPVGSGQ